MRKILSIALTFIMLMMMPASGIAQLQVKRQKPVEPPKKDNTVRVAAVLTVDGKKNPSVTFTGDGGTKTLRVNTNQGRPSVSGLPSWLSTNSVSQTSVVLKCEPNPNKSQRSATFYVNAGKKQVAVSVTQQASTSDLRIVKMEFSNEDKNRNRITPPGGTLYAGSVKYLHTDLIYNGPRTEQKKTLYVKIIRPDGTLMTGDSSPEGYSYKHDATFYPGTSLKVSADGYGSEGGASYKEGKYRVEIYADGKLLCGENVYVYNPNNYDGKNIVVTGMRFANCHQDTELIDSFGSTLYADEMEYLLPEITYNGLTYDTDRTIYLKFIDPNGNLMTGSGSPSGYTLSQEITFESGAGNTMELSGWGSSTPGNTYRTGTYKVEMYMDGKRLYTGSVTLKGSSSYSSNFTITDVDFANERKDGTIIEGFDTDVWHANRLYYFTPRLVYNGPSTSKTVTLYVKLFSPDGNLRSGSSSPSGYTYKQDVTFKPGKNNKVDLLGWGNDSGTSYVQGGFYVWKFYVDGKEIFTKRVYVNGETVDNGNLKFTKCEFANTNYDGDLLDSYGASLRASEMRYLTPCLYYGGLTKDRTVSMSVKIIKPDGEVMDGGAGGYTYTTKVDLRAGSDNIVYVPGWGNNTQTSYSRGTYEVKFYVEDRLMYTGRVLLR